MWEECRAGEDCQGRRVSRRAKAGVWDHQSTGDMADGPQRLDGMLASERPAKRPGAPPEMFEACNSLGVRGAARGGETVQGKGSINGGGKPTAEEQVRAAAWEEARLGCAEPGVSLGPPGGQD